MNYWADEDPRHDCDEEPVAGWLLVLIIACLVALVTLR